uniref:Uncharacterized protein n=1 Tax=Trichobilharzia regenti TaxID=157069 RepID=A0AA85K6Q3_TRIRE|nr:unnamed protein product [Trichobilharzia regenti]
MDDSSENTLHENKRFLLALPTPKRLSSPTNSFNRYRRPMSEYWSEPYNDYWNPNTDEFYGEDKRFLLGLPSKSVDKRFLLGLPSSYRHQKRFFLGLPSPPSRYTSK